MNKSSQRTHDEIAAKAYDIYLARCGKPGNAMDDWLQAEKELARTNMHDSNRAGESASAQPAAGAHLEDDLVFRMPGSNGAKPFERDARGTPSREEIRTRTPHPAARQSGRRTEKHT